MGKWVRNCRGTMDDAGHALAVYMLQRGESMAEIARALHTSWRTVRYNLMHGAPSTRPRRTSVHLHKSAVQRVIAQRRKRVKSLAACKQRRVGPEPWHWVSVRKKYPSARCIASELRTQWGYTVSVATVRRDLRAAGLRALVRPKGPRRRAGDPEARVRFCRDNLGTPASLLLFTDEKYSDCDDHGMRFEWCAPGEQPSRQSREQYATKVHIWGAIGVGVKHLVVLSEDRVTSESYVTNCLASIKGLLVDGRVLVHDGARAHTAKHTTDWLQQHGFAVLEHWPPRSPDLNPIENLWALLAKRVSDRCPLSKDELIVVLRKEWNGIPQRVVDRFVVSFDSRMRKCIENVGDTICTHFTGERG